MLNYTGLLQIEAKSAKRKTVTRKYTTKKKGTVTKVYTYSESELLFKKSAKGYKVIQKSWDKFIENVKQHYDERTAASIIAKLETERMNIEAGKKVSYSQAYRKLGGNTTGKAAGKNRIDVSSMISRIMVNEAQRYLNNMGLTPEEVIEYVKQERNVTITITDLLNPANWKNDNWKGTSVEGVAVELKIEFNYDGVMGIDIVSPAKKGE